MTHELRTKADPIEQEIERGILTRLGRGNERHWRTR